MNASLDAILGGPLLGIVAVVGTGLLLYLNRESFRGIRAQRRQRREREQVRRDFWGYE